MKKKLVILLMTTFFVMVGCNETENPKETKATEENQEANSTENSIEGLTAEEEESFVNLAIIHSEMMLGNDFESVIGLMTEESQKMITVEQLKEGWDVTVEPLGKYLDDMTVAVVAQDEKGTVVHSLLHFESQDILLTLSYQGEKIQGLWIAPVDKSNEDKSMEGTSNKENTLEVTDTDSYTEEEIEVGEHKLKGILTLPKDVENPPVVVFVLGSGPTDMDSTVGSNKPMKDIANGLAEEGIASIRYHKRYHQLTELAMKEEVTVYTEYLDDTAKAIDMAGEISSDIFVVGHSQGGMCAPKIASDNPEIKGIVSMAGTYRGLNDLMYDQMPPLIEISEFSEEEKKEQLKTLEGEYSKSKNLKEGEAAFGMSYFYWSSLEELDTLNLSKTLELPMLFMQGSHDVQVYKDKDFESWKSELEGKENATFILYEGLNHLFMESTYGGEVNQAEYNEAKTVDSQVIKDLAQWIKEN